MNSQFRLYDEVYTLRYLMHVMLICVPYVHAYGIWTRIIVASMCVCVCVLPRESQRHTSKQ